MMFPKFVSTPGVILPYLVLGLLANTGLAEYSYVGETGPTSWPQLFPEECGTAAQSPIELHKHHSKLVRFNPLYFINYDALPNSASLMNSGHTVQVTLDLSDKAIIGGGGLPGDYEFQQFHFHWGSSNNRGSEHGMDGIHYPMELHIVHMNQKYNTTSEAIHHQDGLAVLGVFFKLGEFDNPIVEPIIKHLPKIKTEGMQANFTHLYSLLDFLPFDLTHFYRYNGSLTTPTCNVAVEWTVFEHPLKISEKQLNHFRSLLTSNNDIQLVDNFRPVQPMNNRTVYRNEYVATYNSPVFHTLIFPDD